MNKYFYNTIGDGFFPSGEPFNICADDCKFEQEAGGQVNLVGSFYCQSCEFYGGKGKDENGKKFINCDLMED